MSKSLRTIILFILAAVSTVANYAGLSQSISENSLWWLLFCAAIAFAVGSAIYAFWQAAFEAVVKPQQFRLRGAAWAATVTGAVFILGISSYWNATAIGGKAAQTAALQSTVTRAEEAVAGALHTYTGFRSLVPALQSLSAEIDSLATCEGSDGCITGSPGKSGVYQTLIQLKSKSDGLITAISDADRKLITRARESDACLSGLRSALTKDDAQALSASADCVNGVIADIAANGLNTRIADAMSAFTAGVVIPVSIKSDKQRQAVRNILSALRERADAIAASARQAQNQAAPTPVTITRMSPTKAVIVHWDAIAPSWMTGIVLDLFPVVLLYFSATMSASRRQRPDADWHAFTAGDLLVATKLLGYLRQETDPQSEEKSALHAVPAASPNGIVYLERDTGEPDYWYEDIEVREVEDLNDREHG